MRGNPRRAFVTRNATRPLRLTVRGWVVICVLSFLVGALPWYWNGSGYSWGGM